MDTDRNRCLTRPTLTLFPGRGHSIRATLILRKSGCLSPLADGAKRRRRKGVMARLCNKTSERFSLSLGERVSVELTFSDNAGWKGKEKSGRKGVTGNDLAMAKAAKTTK